MSVFNRVVLRNNAVRTSRILYKTSNPLRTPTKRFFSGEWTHAPLPPDASWLERWAVRGELDWIIMFMGDGMVHLCWWGFFVYRWLIESDAHKIDWHNNFRAPPIVPGRNNFMSFLRYRYSPFQHKYPEYDNYD